MSNEFKRLTPDEALENLVNEKRGHLKIFIGYAPGVGKTYTMLNEANRRAKRGEDVVVGYVESHGRLETDQQIGDLEVVPRQKIQYNNVTLEEMNTGAIIAGNPNWRSLTN